jgi:hypothetical protein
MIDRDKERLELLDGTRASANRRKAAVRIEDIEAMLEVPQMKSVNVTTTPTAADFNALRADVKAISDTLNTISNELRKRII